MLLKAFDGVAIWSENWEALSDWYEEMFELEVADELDLPEDTGRLFEFGEPKTVLWIGYHSEVKGTAKDKYRIMPGFVVEDVYEIEKKLTAKGATIFAAAQISPTEDYHVLTVEDPDGNLIQLYSDV